MNKHLTATAYIFHKGKVLLGMHPKFGRYLPPGGHVEPHETPEEAAVREVKEESGLDVALISDDPCLIETDGAKSLIRPYLLLLEDIPATAKEPAHQHMDCIFIGKLIHPSQTPVEYRWFSIEELYAIDDHLIFPEVITICQQFLSPQQGSIEAKQPSLLALSQH